MLLCIIREVITARDSVINSDILAYDSHAGHCDTVVPTRSYPEVTLPAPLFPHTSSPPLPSCRVVNKSRHVVQQSTWSGGGGGGEHRSFFPHLIHRILSGATISKSTCFVIPHRKQCLMFTIPQNVLFPRQKEFKICTSSSSYFLLANFVSVYLSADPRCFKAITEVNENVNQD